MSLELANFDQPNIISAQRHPKRYESHKYWGRKPANIVGQYITAYTGPGDLVLDPFCGSGVTIFEALALGRNAVGYDLNPIACFIAENLIARDADTLALKQLGEAAVNKAAEHFPHYEVRCACGGSGSLINAIWRAGQYMAKYYLCPQCGYKMADATPSDRQQLERVVLPDDLWYPKNTLPPNADAKHVHELFSQRNLLALGLLLAQIKGVQDETIRNLLLYTFTANVAFTSRLIPVNEKRFRQGRNCSGIWGFKRFWLPNFHVENNVFHYFRNRLERTRAAKAETNPLLAGTQGRARIVNRSATGMGELADQSVDFIFTDPPFGNMIPYLNLSTLWNAWLQFEVDPAEEIIIDQGRDAGDYYRAMAAVFAECWRVLRDGGFLALAFNNKNIYVWRLLLSAIRRAHFTLRECLPARDGEVSFTQTTKSAKGSLRGHFVYLFQKGRAGPEAVRATLTIDQVLARIEAELIHFVAAGPRTTTEIYNHLLPYMVNNNLLHAGLKDNIIERLLDQRCHLVTKSRRRVIEGEAVELKSYYWVSGEVR